MVGFDKVEKLKTLQCCLCLNFLLIIYKTALHYKNNAGNSNTLADNIRHVWSDTDNYIIPDNLLNLNLDISIIKLYKTHA